jgi:ribonuclease VapC
MVKILDASALMAYLEKEPGHEKVLDFLAKAVEDEKSLLMTTVNFGEVYYLIVKGRGAEEAEKILQLLQTLPIDIVPVDWELAKQAAVCKAIKRLPYLDSFAAALVKLRKGELVTTDKNFKVVEEEIKIAWV